MHKKLEASKPRASTAPQAGGLAVMRSRPALRQQCLPSNLYRYKWQGGNHTHCLDQKLGRLNEEIERAAGGILDDRDAAADLRDRLKLELDARELTS